MGEQEEALNNSGDFLLGGNVVFLRVHRPSCITYTQVLMAGIETNTTLPIIARVRDKHTIGSVRTVKFYCRLRITFKNTREYDASSSRCSILVPCINRLNNACTSKCTDGTEGISQRQVL